MKILKWLGAVVVAAALSFLIIGLIAPKDFKMERSTEIAVSREAAYAYLSDFHNMPEWSPWSDLDTAQVVTYFGEPGTVGHGYSWKGNKQVGAGKMTYTALNPGAQLDYHLDFLEPFASQADGFYRLEDSNGKTKVSWGFSSHFGFIESVFMYFMSMEKMMGPDFEKGLSRMKKALETKPLPANIQIKEEAWPETAFVGIRAKARMEDLGEKFFGESFEKIMSWAAKAKQEPMGAPCGVYFSWDDATHLTEMAAAMPFQAPVLQKSDAGLEVVNVPASKAVVVEYLGGYSGIGQAHAAADAYLKSKNLKQLNPVIEQYITDPGNEPDSNKWLSRIWYRVE